MKLTCEQFANILAVDCGTEKDLVYAILNAAARRIGNLLIDGHDVGWHRLGVLKLVTRASKRIRVPSTGQSMMVPERKGIQFVPSAELKRKVQQ